MRKNYFFLAGLLFMAVPAFAQDDGPTIDPSRDAKVIFTQDFEADWDKWEKTPVDTIYQLEYFNIQDAGNKTFSNAWSDASLKESNLIIRTDSVSPGYEGGIILFNGVMLTDDDDDIKSEKYKNDRYNIIDDYSQERRDAFAQYGEDGGEKVFQFVSAGRGGVDYTSSSVTRYTDNYRRNLFVRLNPGDIQDNTSYRLTFYVKAKETNDKFSPRLHSGIFRGYFHSEKPFTMGLQNDADNYKYNTQIDYTKTDFTGDWEKVTYMTYYLNDSIADYFMLSNGYWWSDDWVWKAEDNPTDKDLVYIKQPDKFFVRLSFQSDSTNFLVDNLSLTKSTIAGAEYDQDKLRIDFGYKTNLSDLAKAAKAQTNIPAAEVLVEVPDSVVDELGYKWRFEVWGQDKESDEWEEILIRSAEYHDDGYMYMFTEYDEMPNGELVPQSFNQYKRVLVTFHNPTDIPELTLKYTGDGKSVSGIFPDALNTEWIKNGKIVPDFYNEIATPNPYVFSGVHSLADLPPVIQSVPYEDGSFGLTPQKSFSFKFSRDVWIETFADGAELRNTDKAVATVNEVPWKVSFNEATDSLTITCPDDSWKNMSGDYEIKIIQIKSKGASTYGENVILHYHFGEFSKTVAATQIDSDWRSEAPDVLEGYNPASTYVYDAGTSFRKGKNSSSSKGKSRVYAMNASYPDNCGYQITTQSSSTGAGKTANVYTIVHFDKAEDCIIQFKATGWSYNGGKLPGITGYLYFYEKPDQELADGNDNGFAILEECEKTELGSFTPATYINKSEIEDKDTGLWPEDVETFKFNFSVPKAGDYIFEWVAKNGNKDGYFISNYSISSATSGDLSTMYVKKVNDIYDKAVEKKAEVDNATRDYKGDDYSEFVAYIASFKENAFKETAPSAYNSNVAQMTDAIKAMQARIDVVDLFYSTQDKAIAKLAEISGDSVNLESYRALDEHLKANADIVCSTKETAELNANIDAYEAEIKAVDDRLALMSKFTDKIAETKSVIDGAVRNDYDEYSAMVSGYNDALKVNLITTSDDGLSAAYDAIAAAQRGYVFKYDYYVAKTRQIKELYELAVALGYEFGSDVKDKVESIQDEDVQLSTLLREAAIYQILSIYADDIPEDLAKVKDLDVSALIPNYFLYNEAEAGRDMDQSSAGVWRIIKNKDNTTAFPGWTANFNGTVYPGQEALDWPVDGHVFIGGLHYATSTTGSVSTTVEGLPVAYYSVGFDMIQNNLSNSSFTVVTDSTNTNIKGSSYKFSSHKTVTIDDSVRVTKDSPMTLTYAVTSSSSSGHVGVNCAVLSLVNPDAEADYQELVGAQGEKLKELLTVVDASKAVNAGVEYYTISGIKLDAPKSGQILIRKTIQSNGKVVADKVLIK